MIITIAGTPGSGKSTVAKKVAYALNLERFSIGDFMRQMAEERGMTILELSTVAEKDRSVDEELDQYQVQLGKENDNFIIDGRLSWHFIPHSFKVFLDADFKTRAKRIFYDQRGQETNVTLESAQEHLKKREDSEVKRYKEYYNLTPYDKNNFDLVIDTSSQGPDEVAKQIIEGVKNGEEKGN